MTMRDSIMSPGSLRTRTFVTVRLSVALILAYKACMLSALPFESLHENPNFRYLSSSYDPVAKYWNPSPWVNWVALGAVPPVRDQGNCSSAGWAFASVAAIESAYVIATNDTVAQLRAEQQSGNLTSPDISGGPPCEQDICGGFISVPFVGAPPSGVPSGGLPPRRLPPSGIISPGGVVSPGGQPAAGGLSYVGPSLSVQQVLDCHVNIIRRSSKSSYNSSCSGNGGSPSLAFEYAARVTRAFGGLNPSSVYGSSGTSDVSSGRCNRSLERDLSATSPSAVGVSSYESVSFAGWLGLALAVQFQPVVVNIQADADSFVHFRVGDWLGGVYSDPACYSGSATHSVLVVGYNISAPFPYWIIQNSWGPSWGENGYVKLAMVEGQGQCGMHASPGVYPVPKVPSSPCSSHLPLCGGGGGCASFRFDPAGSVPSALSVSASDAVHSSSKLATVSTPATVTAPTSGLVCPGLSFSSTCSCSPPFRPVCNTDGTQSCGAASLCVLLDPSFLCRLGACRPSASSPSSTSKHGFLQISCHCPPGFNSTPSQLGFVTCTPDPARVLQGPRTYRVQPGVTCDQIYSDYALSQQYFMHQNKRLNCSSPLRPGSRVHVAPPPPVFSCAVNYTSQQGDTCGSLQALFNISASDFRSLNPLVAADCQTSIPPRTQVCIANGTQTELLGCRLAGVSKPGQTCADIWAENHFSPLHFFEINPGFDCSVLAPAVDSPPPAPGIGNNGEPFLGVSYCIDRENPFGLECPHGSAIYIVQRGDTCLSILFRSFKRSLSLFFAYNARFQCSTATLYVGLHLCAP